MSIGQCGVQFANAYWSNMDNVDSTTLPCVVVGSKPAANLKRGLCGLVRDDNIVTLDERGSWSPLVDGVLRRIRRMAEEVGSSDGFILTHSYGGLGSGYY